MYIGSIQCDKSRQWLVSDDNTLHISDIEYCPGLFKIFDEIITNASDNKQNDKERDSSRRETYIKVNFNRVANQPTEIVVENDGIQDFIQKSKQKGYTDTYIPDLAFGILMTSSNYDDNEKRVTGGRNGYGAKLTNIYSKEFTVEIVENGQKYIQTWKNNMAKRGEPSVTSFDNKKTNYIKIKFIPDYAKFHLDNLTQDMLELLRRRVWDIAGCTDNVKVYLDGKIIPIQGFHQYCQHIYQAACPENSKAILAQAELEKTQIDDEDDLASSTISRRKKNVPKGPLAPLEQQISYFNPNDNFQIAVFSNEMKEFQQLSFVNAINTIEGGSHVDYLLDELVDGLTDCVKTYLKSENIKITKALTKAQVKSCIFIVIRCLVINPSFDSQTKVCLKTNRKELKTQVDLGRDTKEAKTFYKSIQKNTQLMQNLSALVNTQMNKLLSKTDGSKAKNIVVPKLDDAIKAGTGESQKCYLYLTEGDSAKGLAVEGISKLKDGRKYNGVFPLRGKVLNVRDQSAEKVSTNQEVSNLKKILGLRQGTDYSNPENRKTLRYGHVVIMSDQDTDGSHIKGLILNLFDTYWPSLLKAGYVQEFITPIVRVQKQGGRRTGRNNADIIDFYTLPQFHEWLAQNPNTKQWSISYYKGLGSSDKKQAAEYFQNIENLKKEFIYNQQASIKLNMAFNKKLADDRKVWLTNADPNCFLDNSQKKINVTDFVDKELVLYELENIGRSIPSVFDGFKPSQRKILYGAFKRNLHSPIKVAQLSGYIAEHSAYHHGEVSLQQTIVSLAQCFCGANNIPLLVPKGQFGSRPRGGQDSAAARYIHTFLQPITRYIFIEADDATLEYLNDEGQLIEPSYYIGVIPMILVNGCKGIATGWSSSVMQYNPKDLIEFLRRKIYKKSTKDLRYGKDQIKPWYRGFTGEIEPEFKDVDNIRMERVLFKGKLEIDYDDDKEQTLEITELPIGKWTEEYREMLQAWMQGEKDTEKGVGKKSIHPPIISVEDTSSNDNVCITVQVAKNYLHGKSVEQLMDEFNLVSSQKTTNMMLHAENDKLRQFNTVGEIIDCFYKTRMVHYQKRKDNQLETLMENKIIAQEKARFIQMIISDQIVVKKKDLAKLCNELWDLKFLPLRKNRLLLLSNNDELEDINPQNENLLVTDDADKFEAEKLLKQKIKDVTDQETFFRLVKKPETKQLIQCYSFLTNLAIQSMSADKFEQLSTEAQIAEEKYEELKHKTLIDLYAYDLAALELALEEFDINVENDDTEKPINIKDSAIKSRVEEVERQMFKNKDAQEDSENEPVLIERTKPKARAAKSETKVDKSEKVAKTESKAKVTKAKKEEKDKKPTAKKPSLLQKKTAVTEESDEQPAKAAPKKSQPKSQPKKAPAKKSKKVIEESSFIDDEEEYDDDIDENTEASYDIEDSYSSDEEPINLSDDDDL